MSAGGKRSTVRLFYGGSMIFQANKSRKKCAQSSMHLRSYVVCLGLSIFIETQWTI